jgi:hypothetical protein
MPAILGGIAMGLPPGCRTAERRLGWLTVVAFHGGSAFVGRLDRNVTDPPAEAAGGVFTADQKGKARVKS